MAQHKKLMIALLAAVVLGLLLHPFADVEWLKSLNTHLLQPIGQIFLRMIFMVVVPLIFSALVLATYELLQSHGLKKIALRTLTYTIIISALSVFIGISLVNVIRPGDNFNISPTLRENMSINARASLAVEKTAEQKKSASQAIVELVPKNPIDSAARALDGEIIPFMVFALIFGIALKIASDKNNQANYIPGILEQIFATCMQVIHFAMALAPYGIFALVFNTVFLAGINILFSLMLYVICVVLGLLIQQFFVYGSLLKFFTRRKPLQFFKACRETYLYAFSTSSSNATLPKAIECAEQKLHIAPDVARFVLTVGASANQNGTAIFEGITVLFLAQVYGIDLNLSQQLYVVLFSILAGIGTAGVPGGSLPLILVLLKSVGIPAEGIGLILGVDRFLDMCRTTINVSGDLVIAALVDNKAQK